MYPVKQPKNKNPGLKILVPPINYKGVNSFIYNGTTTVFIPAAIPYINLPIIIVSILENEIVNKHPNIPIISVYIIVFRRVTVFSINVHKIDPTNPPASSIHVIAIIMLSL
mmetsp:Transcript_13280/g.1192  ORF Transcript_13280/g.1192 Transcript_13280/m.1192 type:complete len:111 (+) Transcript_13280:308-640(+)